MISTLSFAAVGLAENLKYFKIKRSLLQTDLYLWMKHKLIITAWKVSVFGDFLVRIFPYSVRMQEIRTRKTPNKDTFHAVYTCGKLRKTQINFWDNLCPVDTKELELKTEWFPSSSAQLEKDKIKIRWDEVLNLNHICFIFISALDILNCYLCISLVSRFMKF